MKPSKYTVRLLRRAQSKILGEPRQFRMESYYYRPYIWDSLKLPNCGTAACIAGWAIAINKKINPKQASARHKNNRSYYRAGIRALKITPEQAQVLFFVEDWPDRFLHQWERAKPFSKKRARVAVNRINHFIKTGE